jgi:hypothetical protein
VLAFAVIAASFQSTLNHRLHHWLYLRDIGQTSLHPRLARGLTRYLGETVGNTALPAGPGGNRFRRRAAEGGGADGKVIGLRLRPTCALRKSTPWDLPNLEVINRSCKVRRGGARSAPHALSRVRMCLIAVTFTCISRSGDGRAVS